MTNQELLRKFGKQMRAIRQKRGLSQEKLAELAGLHRNYTGILERGRSNPTLVAIVALARALKVRPASLLPDID